MTASPLSNLEEPLERPLLRRAPRAPRLARNHAEPHFWFALWVLFCVCGALFLLACVPGCAIAQRPDGGFVLGVGMSGDGTTASGAGAATAGILSAIGVPGAPAIGMGVTAVLGLLGVGGKVLHTLGKQTGRHIGYEERTAAGTIQESLPPPDPGTGVVTEVE